MATQGPDWQALSEQVKDFLESLAGVVGPNDEQIEVTERHRLLSLAMGILPRPEVRATYNTTKNVLEVRTPPGNADRVVVRGNKPVEDELGFDPSNPEIALVNVDPSDIAAIEFFDKKRVLIARGRIV